MKNCNLENKNNCSENKFYIHYNRYESRTSNHYTFEPNDETEFGSIQHSSFEDSTIFIGKIVTLLAVN